MVFVDNPHIKKLFEAHKNNASEEELDVLERENNEYIRSQLEKVKVDVEKVIEKKTEHDLVLSRKNNRKEINNLYKEWIELNRVLREVSIPITINGKKECRDTLLGMRGVNK